MLSNLRFTSFTSVPHLAGTVLMDSLHSAVNFSLDKPNVLVGPNGAGKSALLTAMAKRFLAYYVGFSCFDDKYLGGLSTNDALWSRPSRWSYDWEFMSDVQCATDNAPALFYKPQMVPGDEESYVAAMMTGYFKQSKAQATLVKDTSSGEHARRMLGDMAGPTPTRSAALMPSLMEALKGEGLPQTYLFQNWSCGGKAVDLRKLGRVEEWDRQAEVLKSLFLGDSAGLPLVLMDEPEQSLDALAEMRLWRAIESSNCSKVQVVVATHSLYPLLHRDKFNLIEAVPGYVESVLKLL